MGGKIYGTKKSKERREEPLGTMSYQTSTNQKPERRRPFGTGLVRHCPQGLFSPFFTFLRAIYFSSRLDFSSSPLSAPGSPRMYFTVTLTLMYLYKYYYLEVIYKH